MFHHKSNLDYSKRFINLLTTSAQSFAYMNIFPLKIPIQKILGVYEDTNSKNITCIIKIPYIKFMRFI